MTSILTNVAAMSALQTLRTIGQDMETTQGRVSSGLRVGEAADNAAYWSIATTMRSDNGALSAVQDALGLGAAKIDTAYAAMESAIDVVEEIKVKLVAASEAGVDKSKVQEEISQLQDQLASIASSASFSGENWLKADIGGTFSSEANGYAADDAQRKQIVGSFTRDSDGNVAVKTINVTLDETNVLFDTSGGNAGLLDSGILINARNTGKQDTNGDDIFVSTEEFNKTWVQDGDVWVDQNSTADDDSDDTYYVQLGGAFVKASSAGEVLTGTDADIATVAAANFETDITVSSLDITKIEDYKEDLGLGSDAGDNFVMDVLISFVDAQLEKMTSAAADLGSISMRIGMQEDFVSKLTDSIGSGIGRLVDADMNEESTRLKALQTQQQLGVQALSIANSNSENILSLFR